MAVATHSVAPNAPFVKQTDFAPELTVSHDNSQFLRLAGPPTGPLTLNPLNGKPTDSLTLWQAMANSPELVGGLVTYLFENATGWWTDLLPRRRAQGLVQMYSHADAFAYVLDEAPEDVAPRYVSIRNEVHETRLARYNLGLKERGDFFKTEGGQESYMIKLQILVMATLARARLLVAWALVNCKMEYVEHQRLVGPQYTSMAAAMENEINLFGALTRDELGLYKLQAYVVAVTLQRPQTFDIVIVPSGSLTELATCNAFETERLRRGPSAERHLSAGGRSLAGVLAGRTIYEDTPINAQNIEAIDLEPFRRTVTFGGYVMIDGSDMGGADCAARYCAAHALTVYHPSMDVDDYKPFTYEQALRDCLRFEDTPLGRVSMALDNMLRQLPVAVQKAGVTPVHGLIDPFLYRLPTAPIHPSAAGLGAAAFQGGAYRVVTVFGDMEPAYLTNEQCEKHGKVAAAKLRAELPAEVFAALDRHRALIDRLHGVTTLDVQSNAFAYAVAANPANAPSAAGASYLGGIALPYRTADGRLFVHTADGTDRGVVYDSTNGVFRLGTVDEATTGLAPPLPFGYGSVAGVAAMAAVYDAGRAAESGWGEALLHEASIGHHAFLRYVRTLRRVYPNSVFFNPDLAPAYAASAAGADPDADAIAAFAASVYDRVKQPLMVRVPTGDDLVVALRGGRSAGVAQASDARDVITAAARGILDDMGFASAAAPGGPAATDAESGALVELLSDPRRRDDRTRLALLDPVVRKRAFAAFRTSGLAKSYADNVLSARAATLAPADRPASADATSFAHFFKLEVVPRLAAGDAGAAEGLLTSAINAAAQRHTSITEQTLRSWAAMGVASRQQMAAAGRGAPDGAAVAALAAADDEGVAWVNSRLVVAPRTWTDLSPGLSDSFAARLVVRPINPQAPMSALAPSRAASVADLRAAFDVASRACASANGIDGTVLANSFVLPDAARSAGSKRPRGSYADDAEAEAYAPGSACDALRELINAVDTPLADRVNLARRFAHLAANCPPDVRVPAQLMITSLVARHSLATMFAEDVPPPVCCFALVNWHITLQTDAMVFATSGRETGELLWNWEDMSLQYDAAHKIWGGHLSVWMGAYIKAPERVFFVPDARFAGYINGLDDTTYTNPDAFDPAHYERNVSAFVFDMGGATFSRARALAEANPLSLQGRYLPHQAPAHARFANRSNVFAAVGQQWPTFIYYNWLWSLTEIGVDVQPDASSYARMQATAGVPGLCFQRRHLGWSARDAGFAKPLGNTGHLRDLDPPLRGVFSGQMRFNNSRLNGVGPVISASTVLQRTVVAS